MVLLTVVLVVGCKGGGSSQDGTVMDTQPAQAEASTKQGAEYAMGETFDVNGLTWTVIGFEQLAEIESRFSDTEPYQPENGAWLVVTLEFKGVEGISGGYDIAALKARDAGGEHYNVAEPSGAADSYRLTHEGVKNLSMAMVGNKEVQRVFAIYDVPDAGGPFALEWMGVEDGSLVTLASVVLSE